MSEEKNILNKRIQLYLSDEAREALIRLMGADGKPSPTINEAIITAVKLKQSQAKQSPE